MTDPYEPALPYAGTSGYAAGVDTSRERALASDADGTTARRQVEVLMFLDAAGEDGATWAELAEAHALHHGQASGVLSALHKAERIARLTVRRHNCFVYVLPENVKGRETQRQGYRVRA